MPRAKTLDEATKLLDPRPLDFSHPHPQGAQEASDPDFYAAPPAELDGNNKLPGPMEKLQRRLLGGTREVKLYLAVSRVLECFNDVVWFEANPVLWSALEDYDKRRAAQPARP